MLAGELDPDLETRFWPTLVAGILFVLAGLLSIVYLGTR